jgi:hypothetical protein
MKAHSFSILRSLAALSLMALAPLGSWAAKPGSGGIPLVANVFSSIHDEQTNVGCPYPPFIQASAGLRPDAEPGASFAWDFFLSPWDPANDLASGLYENGTFPVSPGSWLRVELNTNNKNFLIDTRTTAKPLRKFTLDFSQPVSPVENVPPFGVTLATPGLFEALGSFSLTSMAVCTTKDCPEARTIRTKFWFVDPSDASVEWRVDWEFIRVLRVSTGAWYFIADACDGSQVAGLSKLIGNRTQPRDVNNGTFLIPLFISVTLRQ